MTEVASEVVRGALRGGPATALLESEQCVGCGDPAVP